MHLLHFIWKVLTSGIILVFYNSAGKEVLEKDYAWLEEDRGLRRDVFKLRMESCPSDSPDTEDEIHWATPEMQRKLTSGSQPSLQAFPRNFS